MNDEESTIEQKALALYRPPFRFYRGYIFDAENNTFADTDKTNICRVRGWGRISYTGSPEKLQDAVGEHIAKALTAYWEKNATAPNIKGEVE